MSAIPSVIALPAEMQIGAAGLDSSLPPAARSNALKIFPTNVSSITQTGLSQICAAGGAAADQAFPSTNIVFDLPAGQSPSQFLDPRSLCLNFRMTVTQTTAASGNISNAFLRSSAYSWFSRQYINTQNGVAEDITELGIVADTLLQMTQSESVRDATGLMYGQWSSGTNTGNNGSPINMMTGRTPAAGDTQTLSFCIPIISSLIGATANKMCNIGRTSKLQLVLQTDSIAPISVFSATAITAGAYTVTLSDFFLNVQTVDIGSEALRMLDAGMPDGKAYYSGTTYRTSTSTIPAGTTGAQSLLVGLRGSSVKSLVARFFDTATGATTGSVNGKYDSKLPNCNSINFNVQGVGRMPNTPVNPLLYPANSLRETQLAFGLFNSATHSGSVLAANYCKLAQGGTTSSNNFTLTAQDQYWTTGSNTTALCSYYFAVDTEVICRRGLFSGLNCLSSPIFLELNIATANTNAITAYVTAMLDTVYIHDVNSGDIQTRV